jgi:hypothetical protein
MPFQISAVRVRRHAPVLPFPRIICAGVVRGRATGVFQHFLGGEADGGWWICCGHAAHGAESGLCVEGDVYFVCFSDLGVKLRFVEGALCLFFVDFLM